MRKPLPSWFAFIAVFQVVPILILPPDMFGGIALWIWAIPIALFALIAWGLFRRSLWALTATIFIQGFSVIIRLLALLPGAVTILSKSEGTTTTHTSMIIASLLSIALSTLILLSVDRPEVTATLQ